MRFANIIRLNEAGEREVVPMRWGFAAKADKNPSRPKHMHARSETIDRLPNGKTKQWVITPNDGKPIAIAVICEKWTNGDETLDTFIQVTTPANALISKTTDRMPAILQPEDWEVWLGEREGGPADVKMVLRTFEDGGNWTMTEQETNRQKKDSSQKTLF